MDGVDDDDLVLIRFEFLIRGTVISKDTTAECSVEEYMAAGGHRQVRSRSCKAVNGGKLGVVAVRLKLVLQMQVKLVEIAVVGALAKVEYLTLVAVGLFSTRYAPRALT